MLHTSILTHHTTEAAENSIRASDDKADTAALHLQSMTEQFDTQLRPLEKLGGENESLQKQLAAMGTRLGETQHALALHEASLAHSQVCIAVCCSGMQWN